MAFEQVFLRLPDGRQFGPVPFSQLYQWHAEGRIPANAHIVDAATGEAKEVSAFATLVVPPPTGGTPAPPAQPSGFDHLIPARNGNALAAYYVSIASLFCCLLPLPGGIVAIILGAKGLKAVPATGVGKTHSIVAIVLGSFTTLVSLAWLVFWILFFFIAKSHGD